MPLEKDCEISVYTGVTIVLMIMTCEKFTKYHIHHHMNWIVSMYVYIWNSFLLVKSSENKCVC